MTKQKHGGTHREQHTIKPWAGVEAVPPGWNA